MANSNEVSNSHNFRWLYRKGMSHSASSSSANGTVDRIHRTESLPKSNTVLPGFCNNFLTEDNGSGCLFLRNNIKDEMTFSSEGSSSSSRQSSVDSYSSSNSADAISSSELFGSLSNSPCRSVPSVPAGPKYKLIHEGDIQVCRLNHTHTVISKILSSKFLRRWENHHLYLSPTEISSKTPSGFMEDSVQYGIIEDVYVVTRWDSTQKYCVRIVIPDGSLLLQVNNAYVRDQWLHSIIWKKNILKYRKILTNTRRPEIFLKELKGLIEMAFTTPLQDDCIYYSPLEIISELLQENVKWLPKSLNEEVITVVSPLLEMTTPTPEICDFLGKHCQENPRSRIVLELFNPVIQRILKHNMDFGKYPKARVFVQQYIQALSYQNDGKAVLQKFINSIHGISSTCPHPRVLPNLVSICLSAIYSLYEEQRNLSLEERNDNSMLKSDWETRMLCFVTILENISNFEDWRPNLAQLLQPIPFPDDAIADNLFTMNLKPVIENFCNDERCEVHLMVLGVRDKKEGWFQLYCPGGIACDDEGDLWSKMVKTLLECCCRRKKFLEALTKHIGICMLRALRDDQTMQMTLCYMLEMEVIENKDHQLQVITTLQSTKNGKQHYAALCQRQQHLRELQQKGGPRKLTLPFRSTDADVAKLLSCGSFGNLECLSLAFTQVTSACAEQLIKLPSLRELNLWCTQFGDSGLRLICEHLHKLQVLNLCETPVTDKGLQCLTSMKSLKILNLNSTQLTAQTFEKLKQKLPALQECDIRYTDAW